MNVGKPAHKLHFLGRPSSVANLGAARPVKCSQVEGMWTIIHLHLYTYMYVRMYVCMYVCMYVW